MVKRMNHLSMGFVSIGPQFALVTGGTRRRQQTTEQGAI
jgi:hypothetical protein